MKKNRSKYQALPGWLPPMSATILLCSATAFAGQGPQPTICSRACWGARAPQCGISQMAALDRAIIHHTAGSGDWTTDYATAQSRVRGIQNQHMDAQGWCDIGYHFLVDAGGHIFEGRSGSLASWPRGTHDCANGNSFGFNLMGYFHPPYNQTPTTAGRSALYDVIAWRMPSGWSPYGASAYAGCEGTYTVGSLDGHLAIVATACPGAGFYNPYITANYNGGEARDGVNARKNGVTVNKAICDFNGDGKTDLSIWRPSNGQWHIPGIVVVSWGVNGDIPVNGDFNGDGKADRAVWRPSDQNWFNYESLTQVQYGLPGDIPVPGDYDGNGTTDLAVWRPSTGQWFIKLPGVPVVSWGGSGDIPVVGDYNGDGKADRAVWRPSNQYWYNYESQTSVQWGLPGDIPVPGDYDGNKTTDRAVWRPSNGQWHIPGIVVVSWGVNGDMPVPGDYNGDGKTDRAVWRPSTQNWFNYESLTQVQWGLPGDKALPVPWAIRRSFFP